MSLKFSGGCVNNLLFFIPQFTTLLFDSMLKCPGKEIDLLTDIDMNTFICAGIRGDRSMLRASCNCKSQTHEWVYYVFGCKQFIWVGYVALPTLCKLRLS